MIQSKYFIDDKWNLAEYPAPLARRAFARSNVLRILDFSGIRSPRIKQDLKDYISDVLDNRLPANRTDAKLRQFVQQHWRQWQYGIEFLSLPASDYPSIEDHIRQIDHDYQDYMISVKGFKLTIPSHGLPHYGADVFPALNAFLIERKNRSLSMWQKLQWSRDELPLSSERINPTSALKTLRFEYIRYEENLRLVQLYMKHLVLDSKVTFLSICHIHSSLRPMITYMESKGLLLANISRENVEGFYGDYGRKICGTTLNSRISECYRFFDYLCTFSMISSNPFDLSDMHQEKYHQKMKAVDHDTIIQLFSVLDKVKPHLVCMFLLIYCTGMRVSEVCLVRNDGLFHNEKGYFIRFHNQKMRKPVVNQLPEALYKKLQQIVEENASLDYDEEYMFHTRPNMPYLTSTFMQQFSSEIEGLGIQNKDGTPFIFRPHDWRHTLATRMYRSDIDIGVIQSVLHHASVEMTMVYVEVDDLQMKKLQTRFLDYRGRTVDESTEAERIEYIRSHLAAQVLPNGVCSLPVSLGKCPHGNSCLDGCQYFRTSREHLASHIEYAKHLEQYITLCRENGWNPQADSASRVLSNLSGIIRSLQNESE